MFDSAFSGCDVAEPANAESETFIDAASELEPESDIEDDYESDDDYAQEIFNEHLFEKKISYRQRVECI